MKVATAVSLAGLVAGCTLVFPDGAPWVPPGGAAPPPSASSSPASGNAPDPFADLDPRPFGMHPAIAFDVVGDRYALAREARVAWARDTLPYMQWDWIDPQRTGDPARMRWSGDLPASHGDPAMHYDFDQMFLDQAANGMSALANIGPGGDLKAISRWTESDARDYQHFVQTVVRRYPAVRTWQVANEPALEGGPDQPGFVRLMKLSHAAIKAANPRAIVVAGGATGWDTPDERDSYFERTLADLAGCCLDVLDFHYYGDSREGVGYAGIEKLAAYYRRILDENGFKQARIWSTENGTFSGTIKTPQGDVTRTEADQARDLPKRMVVALASGVDKLFWAWGMTERFGPWDDDLFDHTGLAYDGHGGPAGSPKLAYWALWQLTRQLADCDWTKKVTRLETGVPQTRAYRLPIRDGKSIVVAWWDYYRLAEYTAGQQATVSIPWDGAAARQLSAVPAATAGADVTDPGSAFLTTTLVPDQGQIAVALGPDPVYLVAD